MTTLRNRARLRRAHLTALRNRARLRRANTPESSPPAAGPLDSSPKSSPPVAGHHVLCQTAIFETFHSISHQPGRVRGSHLVRLVRKDQAVILKSLNPIFVPDNSARENPNTSANPQHLDLLPVSAAANMLARLNKQGVASSPSHSGRKRKKLLLSYTRKKQ